MVTLPITSFYAGLCGLILIKLVYNVTKIRRKTRIAVGVIKTEEYERKNGALNNFVSFAPFFLILLALAEVGIYIDCFLWFVGAIFIVARLGHVYSVYYYEQKTKRYYLRVITMATTFGVIVALSALNMYISLASI